eukprot:TRINITY_DN26080_c0_g1_i1.p1 TRINITY_DN26080_c0_g1~~TRINITY_DN26080_c0_g1_i1.p1  ORF type:complete len:688 (+),score=107.70 TRINITY_DN26080_c0_g1_i1:107-2065(+)
MSPIIAGRHARRAAVPRSWLRLACHRWRLVPVAVVLLFASHSTSHWFDAFVGCARRVTSLAHEQRSLELRSRSAMRATEAPVLSLRRVRRREERRKVDPNRPAPVLHRATRTRTAAEAIEIAESQNWELPPGASMAVLNKICSAAAAGTEGSPEGETIMKAIDMHQKALQSDRFDHDMVLRNTAICANKLHGVDEAASKRLAALAGDAIQKHAATLQPGSVTMILRSYAQMDHIPQGALGSIILRATSSVGLRKFKPDQLSNFSHSLASLGVPSGEVWEALAAETRRKLELFEPSTLSPLMWGFGKAGIYDEDLFEAVSTFTMQSIGLYSPGRLSTLAWSYASAYDPDEEEGEVNVKFLDTVCKAASWKLEKFKTSELSTVLWAMATLGYSNTNFLASASGEALKRIGQFGTWSLANMVWAFAVLEEFDEEMLHAAAGRAVQIDLQFFEPQALANLIWSFGKLKILPSDFFNEASVAAQGIAGNFSAQELAMVAWSYGRMGIRDEKLFASLSAAAQSKIDDFTPQGLGNMAYAFARLGLVDEPLMRAIALAALRLAPRVSRANWRSVTRSCGMVSIDADQLMLQLINDMLAHPPDAADGVDDSVVAALLDHCLHQRLPAFQERIAEEARKRQLTVPAETLQNLVVEPATQNA